MLCSIEDVALHGLDLPHLHGGAGFQALQHDLSGLVRVVDAIVRANGAAIAVHDLEGHTGQRLVLRSLDEFADDQRGGRLVIEGQAVGHAGAHHDILRGLVFDVACGGLALGDHIGPVGGQAGDGDRAVRPGDIPPDVPALAVLHGELRALQGLLGHRVPLQDGQGAEGIIVKSERLSVPSIDHHGLRGGVRLVVVRGLDLGHHIGAGEQLGKDDLPTRIGGVESVGAGEALVVRGQLPVGAHDLELRAGERLLGDAVVLLNNQAAFGGVGDDDRLGVPIGADDYVGAGGVHDVPCRRLGLGQHIGTGGEVGNANFAVAVGGEQPILGQRRRADDPVQAHLTASGGGDPELRAGEGLTGDAVPLLNNNAAPGLIFEGKGYGFALLDLNRLALRVDEEASRGLDLGDYHALSRLQAGNADL